MDKKSRTSGSGIGLKPGDIHYRAYVGPPEDYDLIAAMVFNLLTNLGLRQGHRVLDIGCGSLRIGRLLIPYLDSGNYIGLEPNKWLVEDGICNEIGADLVNIKKPTFSFQPSLKEFKKPLNLDYAVAQSIFSHCSMQFIKDWLKQTSFHLKDTGVLFATFLADHVNFGGSGWIYPDSVAYRIDTMSSLATENGLQFYLINWKHPRQTWAMFSKPKYDKSLAIASQITWNQLMESRTGSQ